MSKQFTRFLLDHTKKFLNYLISLCTSKCLSELGKMFREIYYRRCRIMTTNQVAYWNLQELRKHNRETERQTDVQNDEQHRHNVTTEDVSRQNLLESARHNSATEIQQSNELIETSKHNRQMESETSKHNRRTEAETKRANKANERINRANSKTNRRNASTNAANAATNARNAATNERNASVNERNAATNEKNARTQASKVGTENTYTQSKTKEQNIINKHANTREGAKNAKTIVDTVESGTKAIKNLTSGAKDISDIVSSYTVPGMLNSLGKVSKNPKPKKGNKSTKGKKRK